MKIQPNHIKSKLFPLLWTAFFFSTHIHQITAETYFEESRHFQTAYREITALNLEKGFARVQIGKKLEPNNLLYNLLENYIDFFTIFSLEREADFHYLKQNKDRRIRQIRSGPKDSPYFLHAQAEINLQWAFTRIRFEEYWNAAWELRRAYRLLEQNIQQYPDFKPSQKSHALIRVIAGSIPERYHWIVNLFGISPNYIDGVATLEQLVLNETPESFLYFEESLLILCMVKSILEIQPTQALELLSQNGFPKDDRTITYFTAIHIAVYNRENEKAQKWLEELNTYFDFKQLPLLFYLNGMVKLQRLDSNAVQDFYSFLEHLNGPHQIKNTYQKIAWAALINTDTVAYGNYMQKVMNYGASTTDGDKQAYAEAKSGKTPHPMLLKARLLTDGGFHEGAMDLLNNFSAGTFHEKVHQVEYFYRLGRVSHFQDETTLAIQHYRKTMELGSEMPQYFAANAALQLGLIFEEKRDFENARKYFRESMRMPDHPYKQSIDQRAKAGLKRVEG